MLSIFIKIKLSQALESIYLNIFMKYLHYPAATPFDFSAQNIPIKRVDQNFKE